ncbi:MAG: 16S rRNA (uracil(1498)-N(3))-methyltransferase [Bacilli bacterium]|nr:16S rRNA (uracil(1498)-N(3))-methyltransferase [Bacilli bacterium]
MQEYFAINKINEKFILSEQDNFHIERVLRMKNGDHIIVTYESKKYDCIIDFKNGLNVTYFCELEVSNELECEVTLIYGLPKKDKFEMVVQKSCELGVTSIVPFLAKRSIPVLDDKNTNKKLERWNMIAKEACEQSKRNELVKVVQPVKLKDLLNYKSELNLIAYEDLNCVGSSHLYSLLGNNPKSITIVVGPEGGFDKGEVDFLSENGFISVSLGKRILRSETAPLYMLSVIGFMNERNK